MYMRVRATACTLLYNIRTAWATVLLFVTKAIPEPQNAEQQDCSPAFLYVVSNSGTQSEGPAFFLYICLREKI